MGDIEDTDIDIAIDDPDGDERNAVELASRIGLLAKVDPALAQELVNQLIAALDDVTGGTVREHLIAAARGLDERALADDLAT